MQPGVSQDARSGRPHQARIAARMVQVLVGIENLRDLPAFGPCHVQASPPFERIDGQCLA